MERGNPDAILRRMRDDEESDWPGRLLAKIDRAPLIPEHDIDAAYQALRPDPTPRELDVLRCASVGLSSEQTADVLGIGLRTVMTHQKRARYRMAAKNTTHAACLAIRLGLIA